MGLGLGLSLGLGGRCSSVTLIVDLVVSINKEKPSVSDPSALCFFHIHTYKVHNCVSEVTSQNFHSS